MPETDGARVVDLTDLFDGREPSDATAWNSTIRDRLDGCVAQVEGLAQPVYVALDAHLSIAWYAGYMLDPKSGIWAFENVSINEQEPARASPRKRQRDPAPQRAQSDDRNSWLCQLVLNARRRARCLGQVEGDVYELGQALAHAQVSYLSAMNPPGVLPSLHDRAIKVREIFVTEASALVLRGIFDGRVVDQLKGPNGYHNTASDLGALSTLFRTNWALVQKRTGIQIEELEEAEKLFVEMTLACGARDAQKSSSAGAQEDRLRAYNLVLDAHNEARRAVSYVRWHQGDAEKIMPSLWSGRGAGRPKRAEEPAAPDAGSSGVVPVQTSNGNGGPIGPAGIGAHGVVQPVEPGMPGGSPFIS